MSPLNAFLGCMVWIPIGFWIFALINWTILGDVDPLSGFVGISVALALGFMAFHPPVPGLTPYIFSAAVLTSIAFPIVRSSMSRRQLSQFDVEGIEQGYQLLGQRPTNPVARLKIAQHLYALGHHGHAIAIADSVIRQLPERVFLDEHRMVRMWKKMPPRASAYNAIPCVECGNLNPPGLVHCPQCGEPFLLHLVKGRFVPSRLGKQLVAAWIVMVVLLGGLPICFSLPPAKGGPLALDLLIVSAWIGFAGFAATGGRNS